MGYIKAGNALVDTSMVVAAVRTNQNTKLLLNTNPMNSLILEVPIEDFIKHFAYAVRQQLRYYDIDREIEQNSEFHPPAHEGLDSSPSFERGNS